MINDTRPTVLVAGGAGFLGSHLCDAFMPTHKVICVDNLSTGRRQNINHLEDQPGFTFIEADIVESLPAIMTDQRYSVILNMASPASPPGYQRLTLETLAVGSEGTWHLLELARRDGARFIHASTSEVYGDPQVHPQTEDYWGNVNCYGERSMYDESKRYAEALIYSYRRRHGLKTGIVRIFNTYGPRMDPADGRVVSNLIVQALKDEPLTLYGDGSQTRSFCYVADLVAGIVALAQTELEGPLNLGNPTEFTIKELATAIAQAAGRPAEFVYQPLPADDPLQRCPDISLAKTQLGWTPGIELNEGLAKTIAYFKTELQQPSADWRK